MRDNATSEEAPPVPRRGRPRKPPGPPRWPRRTSVGRPRRQRLRDPIDWAAAQVVALLTGEPAVPRVGRPSVAELRAEARERHRTGQAAAAIAAELKVPEETVRGWLSATPSKARALELLRAGTPPAQVAETLSVAPERIHAWAQQLGLVVPAPRDERERCASRLLAQGLTPEDVAWLLQLRLSRVRALRPPAQVALSRLSSIERQRHHSRRARRTLTARAEAPVAAVEAPAAEPQPAVADAAPPTAAPQKLRRSSKKNKGDAPPRPRGRPRKKVTAAPAPAPREDQTPMTPAERVRRALLGD